jgi:hypothetical protein
VTRVVRHVLALLALALVAGCVSLPTSGGVQTDPGEQPVDQGDGAFEFTPSGPRPGSSPLKIVEDFLLAMQASPQSTAVARKFLTEEGRAGWFPEKATMVYGTRLVSGEDDRFTLDLEQTVQLDDRGTWLGEVGGRGGVRYTLELVREGGEWRVVNPPDALIIPRSHFESRYEQFALHFFDPSGRILVPEPTWLPRGEQAATLLVRRLLRGPDPQLAAVLRSYIPGGTENVLSVPVSSDGVADVPLSEEVLQLGAEQRELALAQLAWTLRQVTGVEQMRVTVDGAPLESSGSPAPQPVTGWSEYDPTGGGASDELFGIRDDDVVALSTSEHDLTGRFGAREYALREIAVDLTGETLAAVTEDGSTVVTAPRAAATGQPPPPEATDVVYDGGTDLLRPGWDVHGHVWLVDRTVTGARVLLATPEGLVEVDAPGLAGGNVSDFVVSRDGTRLVAVVERRSGDELFLARVLRGEGGRVRGLTRAAPLPLAQAGVDEIRDLAWSGTTSLAVLTGPSPESSQVLPALVDGSAVLAEATGTTEIFRQRAGRVVSSPVAGLATYLADGRGRLYELTGDGQWVEVSSPSVVEAGLRAASYAG